MYEVITIKVDGTIERVTQTDEPGLRQLQTAVGGYIETVPHLERYDGLKGEAYCNEEGRIEGLPLNLIATEAWLACLGSGPFSYKPEVFGDMVFVAKKSQVKDGNHRPGKLKA